MPFNQGIFFASNFLPSKEQTRCSKLFIYSAPEEPWLLENIWSKLFGHCSLISILSPEGQNDLELRPQGAEQNLGFRV